MIPGERTMVLWIPDWPIHAHLIDAAQRDGKQSMPEQPSLPVAMIAKQFVIACSPAARAEGVRVGMREREAQSRCPELSVHPYDPAVDHRAFAPALRALAELVPEIDPLRPGLCAMRSRGPSRYYGGEEQAAIALLRVTERLGFTGARIGIAAGIFAADQAARASASDAGVTAPHDRLRIVPSEATRGFLSPLPVSRAADPALSSTLQSLGIRTLGALAALPEAAVRERFGPAGVAAFRQASGARSDTGTELRPQSPARELAVELLLEPPLDTADRLAFACVPLAERLIAGLTEERLICTSLRVELTDDIGVRHERVWSHPQHFTATDAVNRIRWQLRTVSAAPDRAGAGVAAVRLTPALTDRAAAHEPGLWNDEPDARVHHHLSRLQGRFGHTGVGTMRLGGGRLFLERQRFVPWSTADAPGGRASGASRPRNHAAGPWPGAIPGAAPSSVFPKPLSAELADDSGERVGIDDEDLLTADPATLRVDVELPKTPVQAWSSPWPLRERWWRGVPDRFRLQVQLENGDAWLLAHRTGRWYAEGRYD